MKTNHILRFAQAAALVFLPLAAMGQNLDPTVEVTRDYEGKLMEVDKPQIKMEVPDSVMHFDLEFDYSVTDKPYKGSYEFSPYTVEMKPSPTLRNPNKFYLRAGAGYSFHPELDLIWSPVFKSPFRMNVYATHRSYFGRYWNMAEPSVVDGEILLRRMQEGSMEQRTWRGEDLETRAGVDGRYDWENGLFRFDLGYHGVYQDDTQGEIVNRSYNALDFSLGMASKKRTGFIYRADLNYFFSDESDNIVHFTNDSYDYVELQATEFELDASLGYVRGKGDRFMLDLGVNAASVKGEHFSDGFDLDVVPHYVLNRDRWRFDLGVRLSFSPHLDRFSDVARISSQMIYPDVRVEYMAVEDALKLYLDLGGDSKIVSYSDLLAHNRFANPEYGRALWNLIDVADEKINASLGAEGRIGPCFSFGLRGGYVKYEDALMDGVYMTSGLNQPRISASLMPGLGYGSYDKAFAALDWALDAESIRFDGDIEYAYSWTDDTDNVLGLFMPAAVRGDVALTYDWKDRIFAGVDCGFSTARKGGVVYPGGNYVDWTDMASVPARIPGYADLGISLEYVMNRKFSVWARGGNLLGMTVQRNILYAEKGPYFTAGICLNL